MRQLAEQFRAGKVYLNDRGLNLVGVLNVATLPDVLRDPLLTAGIRLDEFSRLVVIAHAGQRMWDVLASERDDLPDPVDEFSKRHSAVFVEQYLDDPDWKLLYPTDLFFPLNELGERAGWGKPSPLGLGIHPDYGLWWAYRTVLLTKRLLPVTEVGALTHPCDSCLDTPCIRVCPAQAVSQEAGFNVHVCADYRIESGSNCAQQCLARLACPVGREHRYEQAQITCHYRISLATIQAYKAGEL